MKLVETTLAPVQIVEDNQAKLPEGVLLRVTYPICNIGQLNANKRVYERDVWEKVLQDDSIMEKQKNRALFGQAEHPEETMSDLQLTSHVIFETWIDEDQVFQKLDVLDTPTGRIIETLLRAGCKVGMSTRAEGDLEDIEIEEAGGKKTQAQKVVAETYNYVTTDFTADPSTFDVGPQDVEVNVLPVVKGLAKENKWNKGEKRFAQLLLESIQCKECKCGKESCKIIALLEEMGESKIQSYKDKEGDTIFILPGVDFSGSIENMIKDAIGKGFEEFLYSELGSGEGITNEKKSKIWWGADVQDFLPKRKQEESKVYETVKELVGEVQGISPEEQEILNWAIENGKIRNEFPDDEQMVDQLMKTPEGEKFGDPESLAIEDPHGTDIGDTEAMYLKYVLLPAAKAVYQPAAKESEEDIQAKMLAQGKHYRIDLPPGKGEPLYTGSFTAAKEMAKEYGKGTKVTDLRKDESKMDEAHGLQAGSVVRDREGNHFVVKDFDINGVSLETTGGGVGALTKKSWEEFEREGFEKISERLKESGWTYEGDYEALFNILDSRLGTAIATQIEDLEKGDFDETNPNAVRYIRQELERIEDSIPGVPELWGLLEEYDRWLEDEEGSGMNEKKCPECGKKLEIAPIPDSEENIFECPGCKYSEPVIEESEEIKEESKPISVTAIYNEEGYEIHSIDAEGNHELVYRAGNSQMDSQDVVDPDSESAIPVGTLKRYADEQGKEHAEELGVPFEEATYEEIEPIEEDIFEIKDGKIKLGENWGDLPKGWTKKSVAKFAKSLTGKGKGEGGIHTACVAKMKGKVKDPDAFCAGLKDEYLKTTKWRGKEAKESEEINEVGQLEELAYDKEFVQWFVDKMNKLSPEEREDRIGSPEEFDFKKAQNWIRNLLDKKALKAELNAFMAEKGKRMESKEDPAKEINNQIIDLQVSEATIKAELTAVKEYLEKQPEWDVQCKILQEKLSETNQQLNETKKQLTGIQKENTALCKMLEKKAKEVSKTKQNLSETVIKVESLQKSHVAYQEELTKAANEGIKEGRNQLIKEYFDAKTEDYRLDVDENSRALLENCQNLQEVDNLVEQLVTIARRSALHSKPVTRIQVKQPEEVSTEQQQVDASVGRIFERLT